MTTIARQANIRISDRTAPLAQAVINAKFAAIIARLDEIDADEDLLTCELCAHRDTYLYARIDNRDGAEVRVCETCADNGDVSWLAD